MNPDSDVTATTSGSIRAADDRVRIFDTTLRDGE
jgi:2-isopropylmalate synthase